MKVCRDLRALAQIGPVSAAKLVDDLVGESPTSANYPVGTVVISGDGAGDQTVGSPEVKVFVGLHPILGSAVMTTLGLSIAEEQRYDIVTPSADFHETLLATKEDGVFNALLNPFAAVPHTSAQTRSDLAQLVIMLAGINYQALRAEDILALQGSKHLAHLQKTIRRAAHRVEPGLDPEDYKEAVENVAAEIIQAWSDTKQDATSAIRKTLSASAYAVLGSALTTYLTQCRCETRCYRSRSWDWGSVRRNDSGSV